MALRYLFHSRLRKCWGLGTRIESMFSRIEMKKVGVCFSWQATNRLLPLESISTPGVLFDTKNCLSRSAFPKPTLLALVLLCFSVKHFSASVSVVKPMLGNTF